jgi:hypothetical protein
LAIAMLVYVVLPKLHCGILRLAVDLPTDPPEVAALWATLLDLGEASPAPWVLIGAQMVALHAWRAASEAQRMSRDGDVLVDVREAPAGTQAVAKYLVEQGFELDDPLSQGIGHGHAFKKEDVSVDVLAPDNLGSRANLSTLHQARTVSVPGGTQALHRREWIDVTLGDRKGSIPVPDLLGAILLKAEAIGVDDVPDSQRSDLAVLLSIATERDELAARLTSAERKLLQSLDGFGDPNNPVYEEIPRAREAAATYRRLTQA